MRTVHLSALLATVLLFQGSFEALFGNGLTISNAQRLPAPNRDRIAFNLGWQNSWNVIGFPSNHDAAWVFIKFRECGGDGTWEHALLSTTTADHTLHNDLAFAVPITETDRFGNGTGHNTGAMIRRKNVGTGHLNALACTLRVVGSSSGTALDPAKDYDIRVFGIEMVQIKQGAYALGDNGVGGTETRRFFRRSSSDNSPITVSSDAALDVNTAGENWDITIPATYPKGFNQFYCMKYEMTLGQYADFLSTIPATAASLRFPNQNDNDRHRLFVSGSNYVSDRKDRVMNYLSYDDLLSYLDWAALRPMTELEYEKICRGSGFAAPKCYAWGGTDAVEALEISAGAETGSDTILTLNANMHYFACIAYSWGSCSGWQSLTGGDNTINSVTTQGPVGAGIFARDNTLTRTQTGASYYGVMEMSGNVWEQVITVYGSAALGYTGIWGNGMLGSSGRWDVSDWPEASSTDGQNPQGIRGCSFLDDEVNCRVSDRELCRTDRTSSTGRHRSIGGRGVR